MSLDRFVAGPDPSQEHPLGVGGEQRHGWAITAMARRERSAVQQVLAAGALDVLQVRVAPVLLGRDPRAMRALESPAP